MARIVESTETYFARLAVEKAGISKQDRTPYVRMCAAHLRGEFEVFGIYRPDMHKYMLTTAGIDVDAMLTQYRNRKV